MLVVFAVNAMLCVSPAFAVLRCWVHGISVMFVETAKNTTIVAMECEWESVSIELSNGTTFNDIEQPVPKFQGHANIRR